MRERETLLERDDNNFPEGTYLIRTDRIREYSIESIIYYPDNAKGKPQALYGLYWGYLKFSKYFFPFQNLKGTFAECPIIF